MLWGRCGWVSASLASWRGQGCEFHALHGHAGPNAAARGGEPGPGAPTPIRQVKRHGGLGLPMASPANLSVVRANSCHHVQHPGPVLSLLGARMGALWWPRTPHSLRQSEAGGTP